MLGLSRDDHLVQVGLFALQHLPQGQDAAALQSQRLLMDQWPPRRRQPQREA